MALFRRNKNTFDNDVAMPQELQDYYAAENRSQGWKAWILGLTTLLVTLIVALGLFYGGRYAYRKVRSNDKPQTAQNDANKDDQKAEPANEAEPAPANESTPATAPQTSSTSTSVPSTSTPATAAARTNIPSTGPESTVAVFVLVTVLGYLLHRRFVAE